MDKCDWKCDWCGQNILEVSDCSANREVEYPDGNKLPSIPFEDHYGLRCHHCNIEPGNYHHPGCDMERCPQCGGRLMSCSCLDEEENEGAEE